MEKVKQVLADGPGVVKDRCRGLNWLAMLMSKCTCEDGIDGVDRS